MGLSSAGSDPFLGLRPFLVEEEETRLSTTLDELIRLGDEFGGEDPGRQSVVGRDGVRGCVPLDLRDVGGGVDEVVRHLDLC